MIYVTKTFTIALRNSEPGVQLSIPHSKEIRSSFHLAFMFLHTDASRMMLYKLDAMSRSCLILQGNAPHHIHLNRANRK